MCTDIGIIDQGRMVLEGNIEQILSRVNTSNPLVISVCGNAEKALEILKSHRSVQTISLRERDISIRFAGDAEEEAQLLCQLIENGVPVNGFTREKGSLESVFMQLTDHEEERVVTSYDAESGL
jgi:ABC-2 type transport system ATP-binding protein